MPPNPGHSPLAVAALFLGATAIGTSALFVKVSETGPVASGFWRACLALPVLWLWASYASRGGLVADFRGNRSAMIAAGLFFAGDLAVWHWSIVLTSVANATLLANLAPIFVTLAVWGLYRQRPSARFALGLTTAIAGVVLLLGTDFGAGAGALLGNGFGVATAMFYAAYQMTVARLQGRVSTASLMAWSSLVVAMALLPVALASGETLLPQTASGWITLAGLALVSQVGGQSLIAYALAHLPTTFASVGLLLQPVVAALFAWLLLGEMLSAAQLAGGALVLAGIVITQRAAYNRIDNL